MARSFEFTPSSGGGIPDPLVFEGFRAKSCLTCVKMSSRPRRSPGRRRVQDQKPESNNTRNSKRLALGSTKAASRKGAKAKIISNITAVATTAAQEQDPQAEEPQVLISCAVCQLSLSDAVSGDADSVHMGDFQVVCEHASLGVPLCGKSNAN